MSVSVCVGGWMGGCGVVRSFRRSVPAYIIRNELHFNEYSTKELTINYQCLSWSFPLSPRILYSNTKIKHFLKSTSQRETLICGARSESKTVSDSPVSFRTPCTPI